MAWGCQRERRAPSDRVKHYLWQPHLETAMTPPLESPASWEITQAPGCVCLCFPDLSAQKALVQALIWLHAGEGLVPCCPGTQAGHSALHQACSGLPGKGNFPGTGKEGNLLPQPMTNKAVQIMALFPPAAFRPTCPC